MTIRQLLSAALLATVFATPSLAGEVRYTGDGHAQNPVFSADGRHVAFEVNNYDDKTDLHVSMMNGAIASDAQKLSLPGSGGVFGGSQIVVNPTWYKSDYVLFEGSNTGSEYRLYLFQPGNGTPSEMITSTELKGGLTFPSLSPDGSKMAFISDSSGNGDIHIRDSNSAQISTLLKTQSAEVFPQFNSDGTKVLFTRKQNHSEDVFEVSLSTGAETSVVGGRNDQSRPIYAAGGRVLFFDNSRDPSQWDLAVVTGAGGAKKILARGVRLPNSARPAVSPDGQWVALTFDNPTKANSVSIMKVDGSKTVTIPTSYTACGEPALAVQSGSWLLAFTALPKSGADYRRLFVQDISGKL